MAKKQQEQEMMITIEESKYLFAKEMHQHYKELYEVALSELKFKSLNVQHLLSIIEEVIVLLWKWFPHLWIAKIIDNGIDRYNMDVNIHNSTIADWQTNFGDIAVDIEEYEEEECYDEDDIEDDGENDEAYKNDTDYLELLDTVKGLVDHYIKTLNDKKN